MKTKLIIAFFVLFCTATNLFALNPFSFPLPKCADSKRPWKGPTTMVVRIDTTICPNNCLDTVVYYDIENLEGDTLLDYDVAVSGVVYDTNDDCSHCASDSIVTYFLIKLINQKYHSNDTNFTKHLFWKDSTIRFIYEYSNEKCVDAWGNICDSSRRCCLSHIAIRLNAADSTVGIIDSMSFTHALDTCISCYPVCNYDNPTDLICSDLPCNSGQWKDTMLVLNLNSLCPNCIDSVFYRYRWNFCTPRNKDIRIYRWNLAPACLNCEPLDSLSKVYWLGVDSVLSTEAKKSLADTSQVSTFIRVLHFSCWTHDTYFPSQYWPCIYTSCCWEKDSVWRDLNNPNIIHANSVEWSTSGDTCWSASYPCYYICDSLPQPRFRIFANEEIKPIITGPYSEVFPNPSEHKVEIRFTSNETGKMTLKIYNSMGALVELQKLKKNQTSISFEVNISKLNAGVYFYNIFTGDEPTIQNKMMVIH